VAQQLLCWLPAIWPRGKFSKSCRSGIRIASDIGGQVNGGKWWSTFVNGKGQACSALSATVAFLREAGWPGDVLVWENIPVLKLRVTTNISLHFFEDAAVTSPAKAVGW